MFLTFFNHDFSSFSNDSTEYIGFETNEFRDNELIYSEANPSSTITKAFYKINRSINKVHLAQNTGRYLRTNSLPKVSTQIEFVQSELSSTSNMISEIQKKAIKAILLFIETIPYEAEKDCNDDIYLTLLLPHIDEILLDLNLSFSNDKQILLKAFETLKKIFMIRLNLGFGIYRETYISAEDLSLIARQNNLKSIHNAVAKKELLSIEGRGRSRKIDSRSARNWLTKKIKNRLIHFSWSKDGPSLNKRAELSYLNYFKVKYVQIFCMNDLEKLDPCLRMGVYQIFVAEQNGRKHTICGFSKKNLSLSVNLHLKGLFKKPGKKNNGMQKIKFHLLIYKPKNKEPKLCLDMMSLLISTGAKYRGTSEFPPREVG